MRDTYRPFTLVGQITYWDSHVRLLRIADVDVTLEPHVSSDGVAVGVMVLVKGRHDERTGLRLVSQLRPWALPPGRGEDRRGVLPDRPHPEHERADRADPQARFEARHLTAALGSEARPTISSAAAGRQTERHPLTIGLAVCAVSDTGKIQAADLCVGILAGN